MQPCEAAHTLKAFKITSVMRCDVRTFPPTTAAFSDGASNEPSSIITSIGVDTEEDYLALKKIMEYKN